MKLSFHGADRGVTGSCHLVDCAGKRILIDCGRIPLLAKRGFRGEIITTPATRELARVVMLDSAHLQEEEARYQARRQQRRHDKEGGKPLYTVLDALNSLEFFGRKAAFGQGHAEVLTLKPLSALTD